MDARRMGTCSEVDARPEPLLPCAADQVPAGSEILDDAAERFVERDLGRARPAGERSREHLADLAEQMVLADRASGDRDHQLGALAENSLLMVGEEAGAADQRAVDLDRPGSARSDDVEMGAV